MGAKVGDFGSQIHAHSRRLTPWSLLLKNVYRYGEYILMTPRTLRCNQSSGADDYSAVWTKYRKFFSFMICTATMVVAAHSIFNWYIEMPSKSFIDHLSLLTNLCWLLHLGNVLRVLWWDTLRVSSSIRKINQVHLAMELLGVKTLPTFKRAKLLSILLIFLHGFGSVFEGLVVDLKLSRKGMSGMYIGKVEEAAEMYSLPIPTSPSPGNGSSSILLENLPLGHHCLTVLLIAQMIYSELVTHYIDLLFISYSFVLYSILRSLLNHLRAAHIPPQQYNLIFDLFHQICNLTDTMNATVGSLIAGTCYFFLPYYALSLRQVFSNGELSRVVRGVVYILTFAFFLYLSAEINSMMKAFNSWAQSIRGSWTSSAAHEPQLWHEQFMLVAVRARTGFGLGCASFKVTYRFVLVILELIVSYAITISQLQKASAASKPLSYSL